MLALIEQGKLSEELDKAGGKGAFPNDIATLIAKHVPADKEVEDEEVTHLRLKVKEGMTRSEIPAKCVSSRAWLAVHHDVWPTQDSAPPTSIAMLRHHVQVPQATHHGYRTSDRPKQHTSSPP